ncbi:uncharacterized protein LOC143328877 [Chaetodon auriga]|uniref:uncharacterized protein LOC143328877 n=1 Tax=Chaetodon auriga TaxID=39042 RepID=UPI0040330D3C
MKLFPVRSIVWLSLLVLWASLSETEANNPDVCQDEKFVGDLQPFPELGDYVELDAVIDKFLCLLYPTNVLNCTWSFHTLQKATQLSVYISVCDNERAVHSLNYPSAERVGSRSLALREHEVLYVILQFNVTLHDMWTVYTYTYNMAMLEVLPPPQNISASVKHGDLLVTWDLPSSRVDSNPLCFEYQLDMGDQERAKNVINQLSYTELNADPSHTYSVRMRVRNIDLCQENPQWSDWSHAVTVEQSVFKLNTLVIISISLGIPMIFLAVLLLVRYQRVSEVLFPPIPRPPLKYIYFLEKNDTFNFFRPAPSPEPVEEITEVEDTEQSSGKTF